MSNDYWQLNPHTHLSNNIKDNFILLFCKMEIAHLQSILMCIESEVNFYIISKIFSDFLRVALHQVGDNFQMLNNFFCKDHIEQKP